MRWLALLAAALLLALPLAVKSNFVLTVFMFRGLGTV